MKSYNIDEWILESSQKQDNWDMSSKEANRIVAYADLSDVV